jgi:tripeptidyl-peptidase-1
MRFPLFPLVTFLFAVNAVTAPLLLGYAVKERHDIPPSWSEVGEAPKEHILHLQIGLKQSNEDVLETHLREISDPKHHRYKQYLSLEEIARLTEPSKETQERVEAWLHDHGVREYIWNEPSRDWISVNITIEKAEILLQTKYSTYLHLESSVSVHRTQEWSLPKHLHEHIDVVQPTTSFFRTAPKPPRGNNADLDARSNLIHERDSVDSLSKVCKASQTTPECVRTLYGTINVRTGTWEQANSTIDRYLFCISIRRKCPGKTRLQS